MYVSWTKKTLQYPCSVRKDHTTQCNTDWCIFNFEHQQSSVAPKNKTDQVLDTQMIYASMTHLFIVFGLSMERVEKKTA